MTRAFFVLFVLLSSLVSLISSAGCPSLNNDGNNRHGMVGAYSKPHLPTEEEIFELKRYWFEVQQKCSRIPQVSY